MTMSIAILTHSTNPRGGVVHGMDLADALFGAGHAVTLIAPDTRGAGFFRQPQCSTFCIPAQEETDLLALVERRIIELRDALRETVFDVYHAQDAISANALDALVDEGKIAGFVRTVHHMDSFASPALMARQARGLTAASELMTVSTLWQDALRADFGRDATVVGNGVDTTRYSALPGPSDATLRARHKLPPTGRIILSVGGIERRKNTLAVLEAFLALRRTMPDLHLVIAGGASLLNHSTYQAAFADRLAACDEPEAVTVTGPIADADMAPLYRLASAFAYPSLAEGFGLCPLEALSCGTPAIVSRQAPFTEHLRDDDVLWCAANDPSTLASALRDALDSDVQNRFQRTGPLTAGRFDWNTVAKRHLPAYRRLAAASRAHSASSGVFTHA